MHQTRVSENIFDFVAVRSQNSMYGIRVHSYEQNTQFFYFFFKIRHNKSIDESYSPISMLNINKFTEWMTSKSRSETEDSNDTKKILMNT